MLEAVSPKEGDRSDRRPISVTSVSISPDPGITAAYTFLLRAAGDQAENDLGASAGGTAGNCNPEPASRLIAVPCTVRRIETARSLANGSTWKLGSAAGVVPKRRLSWVTGPSGSGIWRKSIFPAQFR